MTEIMVEWVVRVVKAFQSMPSHLIVIALWLHVHLKPLCARKDGTVFDILSIVPFLRKHGKHPISGVPLKSTDLIKMNWS